MRIVTSDLDGLDTRTAYDVWRLRQQVFVVEQDCPYPDDGDWARIGRVVVAPSARGRGLAALLMDEAMALCGDREVRLDAQTGLTAFYEGYGFEVTGPEFDEDGVMHVPMARAAVQ